MTFAPHAVQLEQKAGTQEFPRGVVSLNCGMSYTLPFGFFFGRLKMLLEHFVQTWRMASVTHQRRYRREKRHLGIIHIPKSNQRAFW
jgi:hypothetical protein